MDIVIRISEAHLLFAIIFIMLVILLSALWKVHSLTERLKYERLTPEQKERHDLEEEERIWDLQNPNVSRGRRMTKSEAAKLGSAPRPKPANK